MHSGVHSSAVADTATFPSFFSLFDSLRSAVTARRQHLMPCLPGYTFITVRGTVKEVIVPGYAGPALFLGHLRVLLIFCPDDVRLLNV